MNQQAIQELQESWTSDPRWQGIERPYAAEDVVRLRGSLQIDHTLARRGTERLWQMMHSEPFVRALGAQSGAQAVQQVEAGLKAIYVSGWQVAGDMNTAGLTYPDQSLYPADSVPTLVRRINNALYRADQIAALSGRNGDGPDWFAPIVADAEAGFGGVLNAFELTKAMIEAGAAAVHFEDQNSAYKKCGHMGGKVLVPTQQAVQQLTAARLAADVLGVPTELIARTDADSAKLLISDVDGRDRDFLTGRKTVEGFFEVRDGLPQAVARGLAYAPYADVVWCETSHPDLEEARGFAEAIHERYPGKLLAYNCSPTFNWRKYLSEKECGRFQNELGAMGYKFQFVTLAGFHALNTSMFELAHSYRETGMLAYSELQQREFELERDHGYRAVKHQAFVGAGYFDQVNQTIMAGRSSTTAVDGSTEQAQFTERTPGYQEVEKHHRDGKRKRRDPHLTTLVPPPNPARRSRTPEQTA